MLHFKKKKMKEYINTIVEFIDSGQVSAGEETFYGHPGFYFFHTREELNQKIEETLNKESYDRYDVYYITNYLIKYMLEKYDSHTKVFFNNNLFLPIQFKIDSNKVYIVNHSDDLINLKGSQLISINNVEINKILSEIENIIGYSTEEFLRVTQEGYLSNSEILKSLPSISSDTDFITFGILNNNRSEKVSLKIASEFKKVLNKNPENYSYELIDDVIVIHYNSCKDMSKMLQMIKEIDIIATKNNINNYIVDLRGNGGGDSEINAPLVDYLKEKNIVVIINELVFSSGRMAFVDLKKIGAYSIGTDISTSLNCFGNVPGSLKIDNLELIVRRSSTYWHYDNEYNCKGYKKGEFSNFFNSKRNLLEPVLLHPDEYVYLSISDIINGNDIQMKRALEFFKTSHNK